MRHRTFFWFILPSLLGMVLFIAVPIVSIAYQSLFIEHEQVLQEVETSGPFGTTTEMRIDTDAMAKLNAEQPMGRYIGLGTYANSSHLAFAQIGQIWATSEGFWDALEAIYNLPFYKALFFTLAYTAVVTPLSMMLGFAVALGVNSIPRMLKGPVIFFSLLPHIVTPLIGSLVLFWMIDSRGIIGSGLQTLFADPSLSLKASPVLTWVTLFVYGTWHMAPFCFVVFYAGLQGVPRDTMESAMVDGASRWERIRFVTIPYLVPLATFVALMQLMDNFRVFEPIIGFSASANAISLSYQIFNDLRGSDTPQYGAAAATSMLTILGVVILLSPVLVRTWRDFTRKAA